jgi:hypothetical protein
MATKHVLALIPFAAVVLAGCSSETPWEREYACTGNELASAYFVDDGAPGATFQREYPLTIDFHLRSGGAVVKSAQVAAAPMQAGVVQLSAKGPGFWLSGRFNDADHTLQVVDERTLQVAGRTKQVRTTGQFICKMAVNSRSA